MKIRRTVATPDADIWPPWYRSSATAKCRPMLGADRYLSRGERSMPPCSSSLAAGTAAILVRPTSQGGTGHAEYIEQREGIYRLSRRSGLQIQLFPSHPVRLVGSGDGC